MDEITRWVGRTTERQIQTALARSLGSMELATQVTIIAGTTAAVTLPTL